MTLRTLDFHHHFFRYGTTAAVNLQSFTVVHVLVSESHTLAQRWLGRRMRSAPLALKMLFVLAALWFEGQIDQASPSRQALDPRLHEYCGS